MEPNLHYSSLVIDMHCDSVLDHIAGTRDITRRTKSGHLDLFRMKKGGIKAQVFAIFPDPKRIRPGEFDRFVLNGCRIIRKICQNNRHQVGLALSPAGLKRLVRSGRIAIIIGVEGGHAIEGNLSRLRRWWRAGVRILTITWCNSNELADASWDRHKPNRGLSPLGRKAVALLNRMGMLIDVSHASEQTFYQVIEKSRAPVIASHSGVYSLRRHNRNLKNAQLALLAKRGGVMGQVFLPGFINHSPAQASVNDVVNSIRYVIDRFGPDCIGLGSDFDGFSGRLKGLEDVTRLPAITEGLCHAGYPDEVVGKVLGLSFLRAWETVWQARRCD